MKLTRKILKQLLRGEITLDQAENFLKLNHLDHIGDFALIDQSRQKRTGIPEAIFGEYKEPELVKEIVMRVVEEHDIA